MSVPTDGSPQRKGIPRWLMITAVVVGLCLIGGCIVVVLTLLSPTINAWRLPDECVKQNPDMDRQACEVWLSEVSASAAYEQCFRQGMASGDVEVSTLYQCLVDAGVGP